LSHILAEEILLELLNVVPQLLLSLAAELTPRERSKWSGEGEERFDVGESHHYLP
jgi:hypothetical protein